MQTQSNPEKRREKNNGFASLIKRGYTFGKTLGKGSYASVVKAKFTDPATGNVQDLACKLINKAKAPADFLEKFFPRELDVLTKINHPNIIRVHSILQSGSSVFIFMR
jgi:testis-specific serine kinase